MVGPIRADPTDVALASMIIVSAVEISINVVWAFTPYTFVQTMISTPIFAVIDNVAMAYVSGDDAQTS